jgi:RNA polymerase sigma factor (sigma-70 family)
MSVELETTIRELAPGLLRYCRARTHDPSLAEEIAQDSLVALVQRWRGSGPPTSPEAFVFAIARRRAGRVLRRRRLWLPLQLLAGARDRAPDPEATAVSRAECTILNRALDRLGSRDREVLLMTAAGGLKTSEAARALGISESALKMRTMRARQRLNALLENGNGTSDR